MHRPRLSPPVANALSFRLAPLVGLAALVGVLVLGGCGGGQASDEDAGAARPQPKTRVETLTLEPTSFTDVVEVTGTVEALDDATLSAQTNGPVTMLLDLGTRVDPGAPVAKIDAEEAEAAVEQARAQFELAQDRFERQRPLYRDSILSPLEFEQVRSKRNQARAALQQAQTRLSNTILDAPFAGTIEERFIEVGEQVAPGTKVARLVNTRRVKVTAGIPARYANDIQVGTPVQIDARRYGAGVRTADVTFVGNTIDPESRTFTVEVTVSNEERTLKPEMGVSVRVTRAVLDSALVLPRTAVLRDEAGTHVYVVDRSDSTAVARNRDVALGPETGGSVVVDSGLAPGDEVIVVGQNNVSPGAPLEIADRYDRSSAAGTPYEGSEADLPAPPTQ
ncbi:MAG: efflux RND transporter periplasmic adaptor subunit [Salinibacter sp.]